ncbi:hypothetical protein ON010_g10844 [Phytophthora cinnamomi]|nr:hypothetical protein ON010_g10844 [Phytophthora cinnamomi]
MVSTRSRANPARHTGRVQPAASAASSQRPLSVGAVPNASVAPVGGTTALCAAAVALDPAIAAQVQHLIAVALAAHVARSEGDGSHVEPEREPANAGREDERVDVAPGAVEDQREKKAGKIDTGNIRDKPFDGVIPDNSFDSKARDFREELDDQIADAQILANQVWNDNIKKAILKMFLTGAALMWYRDWRASNPAASYAYSCDELVHEYRPVLLSVDVACRIKSERKRWNETNRDFADRLLQMADALEGGKSFPANARHARVAFVRNAYPKHTDFLETKIILESERPEAELKLAVSVLSRKAETDGRLPDKSRGKPAATTKQAPKDKTKPAQQHAQSSKASKKSGDTKKRAAESNAAVVERKKKPKSSSTPSGKTAVVCWECGGTGHTQAFHQKFLQSRKTDVAGESKASAQLANEDSSPGEEVTSDNDDDAVEDDE